MTGGIRLGVDLGGTKIEAIALADDGSILSRERLDTPRSYDATLVAIVELVLRAEQRAGERGTVGVGIPGVSVPTTGLVKNANSTWLIGKPLRADLEARLNRPVRLANDANCFALSEATDGAAAGASVCFGVIIGTGVGGGIVVNGSVIEGANLIAGEWGHNPLPWPNADEYPGPRCYCGKRGCIETFLSGPGFEREWQERRGDARTSREIVEMATENPDARAALARYVDRLARSLAVVIDVLDPDVIVLGGGMSNLPALPQLVLGQLPHYVFSDTLFTRVVPNVHGDSSGVRGAAWLWPRGGAQQPSAPALPGPR